MRADVVFSGSTATWGGSTMIGGCVGVAVGRGVSPGAGASAGPGAGEPLTGDGLAGGRAGGGARGGGAAGGGAGGGVAGGCGSDGGDGGPDGGTSGTIVGEGAGVADAGGGGVCAVAVSAGAHSSAEMMNGARARRTGLLRGVGLRDLLVRRSSRDGRRQERLVTDVREQHRDEVLLGPLHRALPELRMVDDVGDAVARRGEDAVAVQAVVARAARLGLVVLAEIVQDEAAPAARRLGVLQHHRQLRLVVLLLGLVVREVEDHLALLACGLGERVRP